MLTFSEFKNILQLIASDDSECRILGQELARQYRMNHWCEHAIWLNKKLYLVGKNILCGKNENINYEKGYEQYLFSDESRGIF